MINFNELKNTITNNFSSKLKSPSTLCKAIKECNEDVKIMMEEYLKEHPEYEKLTLLVCAFCKNLHPKKCKKCGKQMTYSKSKEHDYCSNKCAQNHEDIRAKIEKSCIERYGVKSPTLNKDILKKRDENNIKKYGTSNLRNVQHINDKIKQTCLSKYGYETPSKNSLIKEKAKQTCLKKYGVEWTGQSGCKIEKTKETFIKKYGFSHFMLDDFYKNKISKTLKNRNYEILKNRCEINDILLLTSKDDYDGGYNSGKKYKCFCKKCNSYFSSTVDYVKIFGKNKFECIPRCPNCYPKLDNVSISEKEVLEYVKSIYSGEIIENSRKFIKPYELDIVLPELKLAIEFNGNHWHEEGINKPIGYHAMKTNMCKEINFKLIHIWEHDWINEKEHVKNILNKYIQI